MTFVILIKYILKVYFVNLITEVVSLLAVFFVAAQNIKKGLKERIVVLIYQGSVF